MPPVLHRPCRDIPTASRSLPNLDLGGVSQHVGGTGTSDNAGANTLLRIATLVESRQGQLGVVGTLPGIANATSAHE